MDVPYSDRGVQLFSQNQDFDGAGIATDDMIVKTADGYGYSTGVPGGVSKIEAGNTSVECIDAGTGQVDIDVDATNVGKWNVADGLNLVTSKLAIGGAKGSAGNVLTSDSANVSWAAPAAQSSISQNNSNVTVTDAGTGNIKLDCDVTDVVEVTTALGLDLKTSKLSVNGGLGSDGQVLTSTGTGCAWEAAGDAAYWFCFPASSWGVANSNVEIEQGGDPDTTIGNAGDTGKCQYGEAMRTSFYCPTDTLSYARLYFFGTATTTTAWLYFRVCEPRNATDDMNLNNGGLYTGGLGSSPTVQTETVTSGDNRIDYWDLLASPTSLASLTGYVSGSASSDTIIKEGNVVHIEVQAGANDGNEFGTGVPGREFRLYHLVLKFT